MSRTTWLLFVLAALAAPAVAHPCHVTLAEVGVSATGDRLEVALRVSPGDLERALDADLDRTADIDRRIVRYLEASFRVRVDGRAASGYEWVGKEVGPFEAWLYFEVPLPPGLRAIELGNRTFFELSHEQVNRIVFTSSTGRRRSLRLTAEEPWGRIEP